MTLIWDKYNIPSY